MLLGSNGPRRPQARARRRSIMLTGLLRLANAASGSTLGALHALGFHRGMSFLARFDRVHRLVDGSRRAFGGGQRFIDGGIECLVLVFVARRLQHVSKHGGRVRGVPRRPMLLLFLYVMPDFGVLLGSQGKAAKSTFGVDIDHDLLREFIPFRV